MMRGVAGLGVAVLLGMANRAAIGQPADEIHIGHVAGYTGLASKDARDMALGGKVLIESVNATGGVLGKKLRLITADDHFHPEETARLILSMAGKVSALLPTTGSANLSYVLQTGVLDRITLPIVGAVPGNESFRMALHRNLFHFRAGDGDQLEKIVDHLTTLGINDIGILVRNNPSGVEGATIVQDCLRKRGLELMAHAIYDVSSKDGFRPQVRQLKETAPSAIIIQGTPRGVVAATTALRAAGVSSLLFATSYADAELLVKTIGPEMARGFVISQVMPNLNKKMMPLIKTFRGHYARYADTDEQPTYFVLEGYISARLIVEAIRRSKDATPGGVIRGLEQLRALDLGGYIVDFSPTNHNGSRWVELSIIDSSGGLAY